MVTCRDRLSVNCEVAELRKIKLKKFGESRLSIVVVRWKEVFGGKWTVTSCGSLSWDTSVVVSVETKVDKAVGPLLAVDSEADMASGSNCWK